jgi:Mrp family chromosome partitioning ATPase
MSITSKEKLSRNSSVAADIQKRVILSMGGKGGVGKTSVMIALAEWFESNQLPSPG